MNEVISLALCFLLGLILGAIACFTFFSQRFSSKNQSPELTALIEDKQSQLAKLESSLSQKSSELVQAAEASNELTRQLVKAETENARLPILEGDLRDKSEHIRLREKELTELKTKVVELSSELTSQQQQHKVRMQVFEDAQKQLSDRFKVLASEVLADNSKTFKERAEVDFDVRKNAIEKLVQPLSESLKNAEEKARQVELERQSSYVLLTDQVKSLNTTQSRLEQALRSPSTRGRWGEIQLKRCLELSGMLERVDFHEQQTYAGDDGRLRPDVVVNLPDEKKIVIDSKVPLEAYLAAANCDDDDAREKSLADHARQLRVHIDKLSAKDYAASVQPTPDFVVLFMPNDAIAAAANLADATLYEYAIQRKILIATPMTLIALLQTVAYMWKQENIAQNAQEIAQLGRELYGRLGAFFLAFKKHGNELAKSCDSFNSMVHAIDMKVVPVIRRFEKLDVQKGSAIAAIAQITEPLNTLKSERSLETESEPAFEVKSLSSESSKPTIFSKVMRRGSSSDNADPEHSGQLGVAESVAAEEISD